MTTISQDKKTAKSAGRRIWCQISRGVNHPRECSPSGWLMSQLTGTEEEVSDQVWRLWKVVDRAAKVLPGLQRPLGSCYHPRVADVLDVAAHYGRATGQVFGKVRQSAGQLALGDRGLYVSVREDGTYSLANHRTSISLVPDLLGQLAEAIRGGNAPAVGGITPEFFEPGWAQRVGATKAFDTQVRAAFGPLLDALAGVECQIRLLQGERANLNPLYEREYDWVHCPNHANWRTERRFVTDGQRVVIHEEQEEAPSGYFRGGASRIVEVRECTFAVCKTRGRHPNGCLYRGVAEVYLTSAADPTAVKAAVQA